MSIQTLAPEQSILGYVLKEKIGTGGYGEVWRAEAPGGIGKAIKFIFGNHSDSRAQVELKSLDKIKEVRHPFLLSLDRIEVVDGRLVVVSELADDSLVQTFDRYQFEGLPGIPRDELLTYIKNAGDALDYISQKFNLQHLDIKPDNLLMAGGHIKVADFGLVKNIHNVTQSLMNGLTPTYAPPELFDGRPNKNSDQYSLAIVYQEMLTGMRPFNGTTPAQLAAQHMNAQPDLSMLSRGDRIVLQKALSKDPEKRFSCCVEMAEELINRKDRKNKSRPSLLKAAEDRDQSKTNHLSSCLLGVTNQLTGSGLAIRNVKVEPQPAIETGNPICRPTVVVGVGRTGTKIICQLRSKLSERIGRRDCYPAFKMICIDSDRQSLARAAGAIRKEEAMLPQELLEIPLKPPQNYRDNTSRFSSWLSRRWIYNVPRTMQTEGLRPLGRLAFADHCEEVCLRLQHLLTNVTRPEAIAETAHHLEMDPNNDPRVILVGASSGGIGSGCILDLAFVARTILSDLGVRDSVIDGFLVHAAARQTREINVSNTFACLSEFGHFVQNGYPGDESLGIPDFDDCPPFDNTYLYDLGKHVNDASYEQHVASISEYLYQNIATSNEAFFAATRTEEQSTEGLGLRSFGLTTIGGNSCDPLVQQLFQALITSWTDLKPDHQFVQHQIKLLCHQLFDLDELMNTWTDFALEKLNGDGIDFVDRCTQGQSDRLNILNSISSELGDVLDQFDFKSVVAREVSESAKMFEENMMRYVCLCGIRLGGTISIVQGIEAQVQSMFNLIEGKTQEMALVQAAVTQQLQSLANTPNSDYSEFVDAIRQFVELRAQKSAAEATHILCRHWASQLSTIDEKLQDHRRSVLLLGRVIQQESEAQGALELTDEFEKLQKQMDEQILSTIPQLVEHLDQHLEETIFSRLGGFLAAIDPEGSGTRDLSDEMEDQSRIQIVNAMQSYDLNEFLQSLMQELPNESVNHLVEHSKSTINRCGGLTNLLISLPKQTSQSPDPQSIDQAFKAETNVTHATTGQLLVCTECRNIPISNYAFQLLEAHPECFDLVRRIHTRNDVDWVNLAQMIS